MSKNTRLALILLGVYMLTWIMMIGFFTEDNYSKETEAKTVATSENKYIKSAADKMLNKETVNLRKTYKSNNDVIIKIAKTELVVPNKTVLNNNESVKIETAKNVTKQNTVVVNPNITVEEPKTIEDELKGYETIGKIEIPKTGLNTYILKNQSVSGMEIAPCMVYSKGEFNKTGFALVAGHNYRNGKLFSNNNNINLGDKIYIYNLDGTKKTYTVKQKFITTTSDVSFLKQDENGNFKLILQSCTDDESGRIIIIAE